MLPVELVFWTDESQKVLNPDCTMGGVGRSSQNSQHDSFSSNLYCVWPYQVAREKISSSLVGLNVKFRLSVLSITSCNGEIDSLSSFQEIQGRATPLSKDMNSNFTFWFTLMRKFVSLFISSSWMWHKVILLSWVKLVWFQNFPSLRLVSYLRLKTSVCPIINMLDGRKNRWIYAFFKSISEK